MSLTDKSGQDRRTFARAASKDGRGDEAGTGWMGRPILVTPRRPGTGWDPCLGRGWLRHIGQFENNSRSDCERGDWPSGRHCPCGHVCRRQRKYNHGLRRSYRTQMVSVN